MSGWVSSIQFFVIHFDLFSYNRWMQLMIYSLVMTEFSSHKKRKKEKKKELP